MRRGRHVTRRVARRRAGVAVLVAALGAAAWAGLTYWPRAPQDAATTSGTGTTGATPTTDPTTTSRPASVPVPHALGAFTVGQTSLALTAPQGNGLPPEALPTEVWYPTPKGSGPSAPDHAAGSFPLLVFSQGFWTTVTTYKALLQDWASAGFVVAAPRYPTTAPDAAIAGTTPQVNAYESNGLRQHPTDLRHVIQSVVAKAGRPGWTLSGLVDPTEIGIVGQSDGGDVSLAVGYNSAYQDTAVKAVAILSGSEYRGYDGGTYFAGPHPPLLVVQSPADVVNPPGCSVEFYDAAPQPKYYLQLLGLPGATTARAGHLGPYTTLTTYVQVVGDVTTYFFDAALAGQHGAAGAMAKAGDAPGLAMLSSGAAAPTPAGPCPTGP